MGLIVGDEKQIRSASLPRVTTFALSDRTFHVSHLASSAEVVPCRLRIIDSHRGSATTVAIEITSNELLHVTRRKGHAVPSEAASGLVVSDFLLEDSLVRFKEPYTWLRHPSIASQDPQIVRTVAKESWRNALVYAAEERGTEGNVVRPGFRQAQIGALHAIAAHWTVSSNAGLVVMPTGTGKTEVMLAATVMRSPDRLLVLVPSDALRQQTADKFAALGVLAELGAIPRKTIRPVVGVLRGAPSSNSSTTKLLDSCNVVVSTVSALQRLDAPALRLFLKRFDLVFFDEAHHVPAASWEKVFESLDSQAVVQFTATPFRTDGRRMPGRIIFNFPLRMAQAQGYFRPIRFLEVFEPDPEEANRAIAALAVKQLREDRASSLDHFLLARAETTTRAESLFSKIYVPHYGDLDPVVIHSAMPASKKREAIRGIREGKHKIIVCVDMFGEGFDFPGLKIAALHDVHQSLAVTLQFTGRFTRDAVGLGSATIVANTADPRLSDAIEELYAEDSDWNELIPELSAKAIQSQLSFSEFLDRMERSEKLSDDLFDLNVLRPKTSTVIFKATTFNPRRFRQAIKGDIRVEREWHSKDKDLAIFITRSRIPIEWATIKETSDEIWDIYVLAFNPARKLLFIHSSKKKTLHQDVARAVSGTSVQLVDGERMFRAFHGLHRLVFHNVGLYSRGNKLRFRMFVGLDVAEGVSPVTQTGSVKSNVFGVGYANGTLTTVGASHRGRVWAMNSSSIPDWREWCERISEKIFDENITTKEFLRHALIPTEIKEFPSSKKLLSVVLPVEWFANSMEAASLTRDGKDVSLSSFELRHAELLDKQRVRISCGCDDAHISTYVLKWGPEEGKFSVTRESGASFSLTLAKSTRPLETYLEENPPGVLLIDGSEIIGGHLLDSRRETPFAYDPTDIAVWNWSGIDLRTESKWKSGKMRPTSIQARVIEALVAKGNQFVIDDDDSGEAADIIELEVGNEDLIFRLFHCKYSKGDQPGQRVGDLYEVCGQAVRSVRWSRNPSLLLRHIQSRERDAGRNGRPTRFEKGTIRSLVQLRRRLPRMKVRFEFVVVQPGLLSAQMEPELSSLLGAASNYILEVTGKPLAVIAS